MGPRPARGQTNDTVREKYRGMRRRRKGCEWQEPVPLGVRSSSPRRRIGVVYPFPNCPHRLLTDTGNDGSVSTCLVSTAFPSVAGIDIPLLPSLPYEVPDPQEKEASIVALMSLKNAYFSLPCLGDVHLYSVTDTAREHYYGNEASILQTHGEHIHI